MIETEYDLEIEERHEILGAYRYDSVFIDVDSCLCGIEGIDLLGTIHGKTEEIADLTNKAMNGEVPIEDVFARRLDLIRPVASDLLAVSQAYKQTLTPDAAQTISTLTSLGIDVHLLSGGYEDAIIPLAASLGISPNNVHANKLFFDDCGQYAGFDQESPLWQKGGKRMMIEKLKKQGRVWALCAIIGDAVSEVETKPVTNLRIGFGGHVVREIVEETADVFVRTNSFAPLLPLLIDRVGVDSIVLFRPGQREILQKGFEGLNGVRFNLSAWKLGETLRKTYRDIPKEQFDPRFPKVIHGDG